MGIKLSQHIAIILFILVMLSACIKTQNDNTNCPITIDTVRTLQTKMHNNKVYYLVERISGWHEKVVYIQLFDEEPTFNNCNENLVQPIFEDSLESKTLSKLKANVAHHKYELIYDDQTTQNKQVEIEFID